MKSPATALRVSLMALMATVLAPTEPLTAQSEDDDIIDEVIVTGSRISRRDYVSASPITTIDGEELAASGEINLENALFQMPQFGLGQGEQTNGFGQGGRATVNLRGLGDYRNLVLLDGRRLPTSSRDSVTDINLIPPIIIESVEAISGGASAVYGSDAISGVVNFRTRQGFEGIEANIQYGASAEGDAENIDASVLWGGSLGGGRGSFLTAFSYSDRSELVGADRSYYAGDGTSGFHTPGRTLNVLAGGNPDQATVDAIFGQYGVVPGTVPASSQVGFNDDGSLYAVTGGTNLIDPTGRLFVGPTGSVSETILDDRSIIQPNERYSVYGKVEFEISPNLTAYATGLFSDSNVITSIGYPLNVPQVTAMPVSNPFISADFATWLAARPNPNAPVLIFKRFTETGRRVYDTDYETYQLIAGLQGEFGGGDFTWDAYYATGETDITELHPNSVRFSRLTELVNAPDGGASLCNGGYNMFGRPGNSAECLDYLSDPATNLYGIEQDIFEATLQGKLFTMPADDVRFALTATYREDSFFRTADELFSTGDIASAAPILSQEKQSIDVTELAAEVLVPLASNLNLGLGYRFSDYSHVGNVDTYKADLDFRPTDAILLRGSFERAVRAPNFHEAYSPLSTLVASIGSPPDAGDPCDVRSNERMDGSIATQMETLCTSQGIPQGIYATFQEDIVSVAGSSAGNEDLEPEDADTFTVGVVFSPQFDSQLLQGLNISIDYYSIEIDKAINLSGTGADILNSCFNRDGSNPNLDPNDANCQLISRDGVTGRINDLRSTFINTGGFETDGVDLIIDGELHFSGMNGFFAFGTAMNFLGSFDIAATDSDPFVDYANTVDISEFPPLSPLPEFKALTTFDYVTDKYMVGLRWRHISSMDNRTSITNPAANDPGPGTYDLFDLIGNVRLTDNLMLSGGITNLADEQPDVLPPGNFVVWGQDPVGMALLPEVNGRLLSDNQGMAPRSHARRCH